MTRRGNVLVVDDDPDLRMMVSYRLAKAGFTIDEAPDGEVALRIARARTPQLVVLDIMMPGPSGLEVCRQLRAADATADVPVVLLTAVTDPSYVADALADGRTHYMTKPFSPTALLTKVRELLPLS